MYRCIGGGEIFAGVKDVSQICYIIYFLKEELFRKLVDFSSQKSLEICKNFLYFN
jgi:hypothetical protein